MAASFDSGLRQWFARDDMAVVHLVQMQTKILYSHHKVANACQRFDWRLAGKLKAISDANRLNIVPCFVSPFAGSPRKVLEPVKKAGLRQNLGDKRLLLLAFDLAVVVSTPF